MNLSRSIIRISTLVFILFIFVTSCTKEKTVQVNSYFVSKELSLQFTKEYLTSAPEYSAVRDALNNNSITAWHSYKPLLFIYGEDDTYVNPVLTENMYDAMVQSGTSRDICRKVIIPGVDHSEGVVPGVIQGILFLNDLKR